MEGEREREPLVWISIQFVSRDGVANNERFILYCIEMENGTKDWDPNKINARGLE